MAGNTINLNLLMIITSIFSSSNLFIIPTHQFFTKHMSTTSPKTTFLQFYFYDKPSTPNPTSVTIAVGPTTNTSRTFFGGLVMIDDALLKEPKLDNSEIIGRAQGMYGGADTKNVGFLMVLNYVFTAGKYKGSTLSLLGRNEVFLNRREMPIVGGTGKFRLAQGIALAHTVWFNQTNGDAMVQYNVTVYHYPNLKF